ncbi:MAG: histidine kinase [Thermoguttaceae bacterium]
MVAWAAGPDGTLWLLEGKGLQMFGLGPGQGTGQSAEEVFRDAPELADQFHRALVGQPAAGSAELGDQGVLDCWTVPVHSPAGEIIGACGLAVDVTQRHQAANQLLAEWRGAEQRLRRYEQDRRLVAHEIHDGLVQETTGAQMRLEALLDSGQVPSGPLKDELELVLRLLRKALSEARQFIAGMRPPLLEQAGLEAAIGQLIAEGPPGGPALSLVVSGPFGRLDPLVESAVYRIVQEGLANVRRHSRSDRAEVRMARHSDRLELEIRDWGVGFDPGGVEHSRFGLRGIRDRAAWLGGQAEIISAPGEGTRLRVSLPVAAPSQLGPLSNDRRIV